MYYCIKLDAFKCYLQGLPQCKDCKEIDETATEMIMARRKEQEQHIAMCPGRGVQGVLK